MKVKELINLFESTVFYSSCPTYFGSEKTNDEDHRNFSLKEFGTSSYGGYSCETFIFVKDGIKYRSFSSLESLKSDNDILNLEVVDIANIRISQYYNQSKNGKKYYDNGSVIKFVVK